MFQAICSSRQNKLKTTQSKSMTLAKLQSKRLLTELGPTKLHDSNPLVLNSPLKQLSSNHSRSKYHMVEAPAKNRVKRSHKCCWSMISLQFRMISQEIKAISDLTHNVNLTTKPHLFSVKKVVLSSSKDRSHHKISKMSLYLAEITQIHIIKSLRRANWIRTYHSKQTIPCSLNKLLMERNWLRQ